MIVQYLLVSALTLALGGFGWYANRVRGSEKPWFLPNKLAVYAAITLVYLAASFAMSPSEMLAAGTVLGFAIPNTSEWMLQGHLFLTLAICFSFGWGKYFPHGQNKIGNSVIWKEKEFGPADWLANKVVGKWYYDRDEKWVKNWQTVAMSGRFGFTFGLLLFPLLAAVNESWLTLLGVPGSFAFGILYRIAFVKHTTTSVKAAEHMVGIALGLLLALPLWTKLWGKTRKKKK